MSAGGPARSSSRSRGSRRSTMPTATLVDAESAGDGRYPRRSRPISRLVVRGGVRVDRLAFEAVDRRRARRRRGRRRGARGQEGDGGHRAAGLHAIASFGQGLSPQARSLGDGKNAVHARAVEQAGVRYAGGAIRASAAAFHARLSEIWCSTRRRRATRPCRRQRARRRRARLRREAGVVADVEPGVHVHARGTGTDARFTEGICCRIAAGDRAQIWR